MDLIAGPSFVDRQNRELPGLRATRQCSVVSGDLRSLLSSSLALPPA